MESSHIATLKRHLLVQKHVTWRIDGQNRSSRFFSLPFYAIARNPMLCNGSDTPLKVPLPFGASALPFNTWLLGSTQLTYQTASRSFQPFCRAHSRASCTPYNRPPFSQNCPFPWGSGPPSEVRTDRDAVWSWSVQPFLQGSRLWQTDRRPIDRPRYSVWSNRSHLYV